MACVRVRSQHRNLEMSTPINQDTFRAAMRQPVEHPDDCRFIVNVAKERMGIDMTMEEAERIWKWNSSGYAASWLYPHEDLIQHAIRAFVEGRAKR